ncbi:MAG: hypothetical protein AAFY38_13390 [Pseudomonadota bacterium]
MTALKKYQRLEATGLWRATADAQRREVVVSLGDATLTISSTADQPLAHWSLAAIERTAGRSKPAVYHPDGDTAETLELQADEMIAAIETLRSAVRRARPRQGRLRWLGAGLSLSAVAALCIFWLPGALVRHALAVVPPVTQAQIGDELLARMARVAGAPCRTGAAQGGLAALGARTETARISVMPGGVRDTLALPGGHILINRSLVEDYEAPDVAAGFITAEAVRAATTPPLRDLLKTGGLRASVTLLTTGRVPAGILDAYAEAALASPRPPVAADALLARFAALDLPSSPYAYALDLSGESTLPLIEGDPARGAQTEPIMPDGTWLRLQAICGA